MQTMQLQAARPKPRDTRPGVPWHPGRTNRSASTGAIMSLTSVAKGSVVEQQCTRYL